MVIFKKKTVYFFFSSRRRHTRYWRDWISDVCFSDLLKFCISRSLSTISRTATLCTRPAERAGFTLRHSTGDNLKPTKRSRTRRACWALTRFISSRSEEHTSELQSRQYLVCRLLLEKKKD